MRSTLLALGLSMPFACVAPGEPGGDAYAPELRLYDLGAGPETTAVETTGGGESEGAGSSTTGDPPAPAKQCSNWGRCVPGGVGRPCENDAQCRLGCQGGRCVFGGTGGDCVRASDCRKTRCDGDRCVPGGPGRVCSAREGAEDCSQKRCLGTACVAGGIGEPCTADGDCDTKKTCRSIAVAPGPDYDDSDDPYLKICSPGVWSHNNCTEDTDCRFSSNLKSCAADGTCKNAGGGAPCSAADDCQVRRCRQGSCKLGQEFGGLPCAADADCNVKTCSATGCTLGGASTASCTQDGECSFTICNFEGAAPTEAGMLGRCEERPYPGVSRCVVDEQCFAPFLPTPVPLSQGPVEGFAQPSTPQQTRARLADALRAPHPTFGSADAPHEIVMFQDLQCGMCGRAYRELVPYLREHYVDTGRARLVFVEFPLGAGEQERRLAGAALCADRQGQYLEFVGRVYADIKAAGALDLAVFAGAAGFTGVGFTDCVTRERSRGRVEADVKLGHELGIDGTPSFYVDGHLLLGAMSPEVFELHMARIGAASGTDEEPRAPAKTRR